MKAKKIIITLFICLFTLSLVGCGKKEEDALKFQKEYETLNGQTNSSDLLHRTVTIDSDNPFVYTTGEDIVKRVENKETFYVYFGSAYCPWCRSVIEKAIEIAEASKIDKIYYVDIWDGDHKEVFRDVYTLNDDGSLKQTFKGTEAYQSLIKSFANVLSDYNLTDKDGNKVSVGEKRIMAPNFIYVKDGKAIKLESGISDKQEASRDELTDEILEEEGIKFQNFFQK